MHYDEVTGGLPYLEGSLSPCCKDQEKRVRTG